MHSIIPFLLLLTLMLFACAGSPDLSKQQRQGKRIYESLCDKCHKLIAPTQHTDAKWVQAVNKYGTNLKLQQSEKDAVVAYLSLVNDK